MGAVAPRELADTTCPHCGAEAEADQEYCLECGARLPLARGVLPALAGAWRARMPWYPGDWIWAALGLLVIAAVSAAVAVVTSEDERPAALPLVATGARPVPTTTAKRAATSTPAPGERTRRPGPAAKTNLQRRPGELVEWPVGQSAYTLVIASLPSSTTKRPAAVKLARKASRAGLPDVGLLDSNEFPSLHPGYFVIFSGVYQSADDAASALAEAQRLGYKRAITRQIVA